MTYYIEDIECEALQNESLSQKKKKCRKDDTVERALKEWFVKVRDKDAHVSDPLLRQKPEELAEKMGKVNFKATERWFHRWKKRENISFQKAHGEQGDADYMGANFWLENEWPSLISEFSPSDVFNADETGLYFRALPENTYVFKNEKAKGTKSCKERMTLLCCASMTGEKKETAHCRKSKQPRCFKGVKALPVDYTANKNAWMTREIFSQWLIKWDNELDRKIVIFVDNCTVHNVSLNLKKIKLVFLPANTTLLIQLCDQGIIRTLKAYYRLKMRKRVITLIDEMSECESTSTLKANDLSKKINVLEALHLANEAWNNISDVSIRNCFRHEGFIKTEEEEEEEDDQSKDLT
ncbi:tigger transposable element-derived protein 6-like [Melanaphis sacchari]|uniref:tigger transposable element-derived protein 6-like n=1 Tax=Melanaphis sacchari TaxID=742174 RepID=UPI000DC154B5|nr:tigger transposable element-derived protein 6-like [Melanaphis sacchari]